MSVRITAPLAVPDRVWQRPEVLDVLRRRDVGQLFRLVMQFTGASQTKVGHACNVTQGKISLYMSGKAQVEKLDKFEDIAHGLGLPDEARMALGLAPRTRSIHMPQQRGPLEQAGRLDEPSSPGQVVDDSVHSDNEGVIIPCRASDGRVIWVSVPRRTFLLGGMAAATTAVGTRLLRSPARLPAATVSGASPIQHLERMRLVLVESDNLLGPRHVIPTVHEHISVVQQLRSAANGADRRALMRIQAQYGEFASWLHHDAGDFRLARHWTDRALAWSQTAGDTEMTAYILARKSQLAGDMRDPSSALDYAEAALELAPPGGRVRAAAVAYAAHAYALEGGHRRSAALVMLDEAQTILADLGAPESPWAVWMDDAYLDVERARCLAMFGEYGGAAEIFGRAIQELPSGFHRDRGVYLARAAMAHAGAGQVDQAARVGMAALSVAIETESGRIINELAHLDTELAQSQRVPEVIEFRDMLTATLPREKDWTPSK